MFLYSYISRMFKSYYCSVTFQDPASSYAEIIIELYSFISVFLIVISILVLYIILVIIDNYLIFLNKFTRHTYRFNGAHLRHRKQNVFFLLLASISYFARDVRYFDVYKLKSVNFELYLDYEHCTPLIESTGDENLKRNKLTMLFFELPLKEIFRMSKSNIAWNYGLLSRYKYLLYLKQEFMVLYFLCRNQYLNKKNLLLNNKILELLWTSLPCLILLIIAIPSFYYLYIVEETTKTFLTVKIIGNQWYWSYDYIYFGYYIRRFFLIFNDLPLTKEVMDLEDYIIESYMEPEEYLNKKLGASRLLEADNFLLLPTNVHLKLIISSSDVLHSFSVPSLGLKVDAVPGRLNQLDIFIHRSGVFYGQCSEICGIGHGFMPICLYAVSYLNFLIGTL